MLRVVSQDGCYSIGLTDKFVLVNSYGTKGEYAIYIDGEDFAVYKNKQTAQKVFNSLMNSCASRVKYIEHCNDNYSYESDYLFHFPQDDEL